MHEACSHTESFTLWCSNTHGRWLLNIPSMFFKITEILSYGSKWFHNSHMKISFIVWWLYSMCLSICQQLFWAFGIRLIDYVTQSAFEPCPQMCHSWRRWCTPLEYNLHDSATGLSNFGELSGHLEFSNMDGLISRSSHQCHFIYFI